MTDEQHVRVREAGRVVLLSDDGRILLFHGNTDRGPAWTTPGGMVEPGETYESAARRELWEETGRDDIALGPCVWHRRRTRLLSDGTTLDGRSRFTPQRLAELLAPLVAGDVPVSPVSADD